ncbi:hypothetical protein GLA29479_897 [Lysobacter antibioticus]|uniref:hypothetical protein n=1 Tax=Lysobacter antibioticus TaxID=84531 RepID=UPI0007174DFB|nr:hypothetical protein [Lysobacter antibioticus]ALN61781.1 hypothetical protein GLA29479_897 [Lysobacter antibioticus]
MSVEVVSRPMTQAEFGELAWSSDAGPAPVKTAFGNWLVATAALSLLMALLSMGAGWLARTLFGVGAWVDEYASFAVLAGAAAIALGCAVHAWRQARRLGRLRAASRAAYRADMQAGTVNEESYEFSECKPLAEPEHGGLVYLLKIDAGRCLAVYDYDSMRIAMDDGDPSSSPMTPSRCATLRRAPVSGYVFSLEFFGAAFGKAVQGELPAEVGNWPEHGEVWAVPWNDIERRLDGA